MPASARDQLLPHEVPPTAGLPLHVSDLWPGPAALPQTIASQLGVPPLQLECSGTACLMVALMTLMRRAPKRRVVVMPAWTCPLVPIAVRNLGLTIRLCDLTPGHWDMDGQMLEEICGEDTLAIIPTHLVGLVADVDTAVRIAAKVGAFVIEDAAQALGATDHGHSVGLKGDVGFFSLAAGKGLSIYEGGLLVTRHDDLREELRRTSAEKVPRSFGWELRRSVELLGLAALYRPRGLGLAYGRPLRRHLREGDLVAAVGDDFPREVPLHRVGCWRQGVGARAAARLPAFLKANRERARQRIGQLQTSDGIQIFDNAPDTEGSWPFLLVRMPDAARCKVALDRLWQAGVGVTQLYVHALPDYVYLADRVPQIAMPNATAFAASTLSLSNSEWLNDGDMDKIEQCIMDIG